MIQFFFMHAAGEGTRASLFSIRDGGFSPVFPKILDATSMLFIHVSAVQYNALMFSNFSDRFCWNALTEMCELLLPGSLMLSCPVSLNTEAYRYVVCVVQLLSILSR